MEQNSSLKKIICEILHNKKLILSEQIELCYNRIEESYGKVLKEEKKDILKNKLKKLKSELTAKHKASHSNWNLTLMYNQKFFEEEFRVPNDYFLESSEFDLIHLEETLDEAENYPEDDTEEEEQIVPNMEPSTSRGVKRTSFDNASNRTKRRRLNELADSVKEAGGSLIATLNLALRLSKQQRKIEGVKMLKRYIKACEEDKDFPTLNSSKKQLDLDVAIGTMVYNNLSRNQYSSIQQVVKRECEASVFPPLNKMLIAKKACYPENLIVDVTQAYVPVKDLAFHSTKRCIDANKEEMYAKINNLPSSSNPKIIRAEMIVTWGLDGTTAQKQYNQGNSKDNQIVKDNSLITVSMTMHQLRLQDGNVLWDNDKSQSVFSVRPIMLKFAKETKITSKKLHDEIQSQIDKLSPEKFLCEDVTLEISHSFYCTEIDGKVYSDITETPSYAVCQCCGATPNEMSDCKNLKNDRFKNTHRKFKRENLRFSLQPMHTATNVVNKLYEISIRKHVQKHSKQLTAEENKLIKEETKVVKRAMWNAFKVRIRETRQGGVGTSDTAKVARKVLSNPVLLAETLELDVELVTRISVILAQIRSRDPVKSLDEFEKNCTETYKMFLDKYSWFKVPVSLHRVLAHGRDYMEALPLPLGRMSEEAAESQNKLLRNDREFRARKTSRIDNLTDVIHRRYITSDPVIHKKYMDVMNKRSKKRNDQDENEISDQESENDEEEIELMEPESCDEQDDQEYNSDEEDDPDYYSEEEFDE